MRIDSHQHYWKLDRGDYSWLTPDAGILYRDYLPEDLAPMRSQNNIDRTILVQAAPTVAETEFLLDLYEEHESIAGVVGWMSVGEEAFAADVQRLKHREGLVGIRPMIQDIPDDDWIITERVVQHLRQLVDLDLALDLLVLPRHLPNTRHFLNEVPDIRAVIDHGAKPFIADGTLEPWKTHLSQIAEHPNVMCKLSGLITEADHANWTVEDLRPYVSHIVDVFGPDRIMFGSDWPVCLLAGTYEAVVTALEQSLPQHMSEAEKQALFGENAARFYRLNK